MQDWKHYFSLPIFRFVKPLKKANKNNQPVDANFFSLTFVYNECGPNKPSRWSKENFYTFLRSKRTWSICFQAPLIFVVVAGLTALSVKVIFGNTKAKNISLLFFISVARITKLLIKKKRKTSCTQPGSLNHLGYLFLCLHIVI